MNRPTVFILYLGVAVLAASPFLAIKLGRRLAAQERMSLGQRDEEDNSPEAIKTRLEQETRSQLEHEKAVQEKNQSQLRGPR